MGLFDFMRILPTKTVDEDHVGNYSVAGGNGANPSEEIVVDPDRSKGIFKFGLRNSFPRILINLYDTSPTNQAIINRTALMIAGGNVELDIKDTKNLLNLVHILGLKKYTNPRQNIEQVIQSVSFDAKLHGRYAIETIWNEDHDRVVQLRAVSAEGVRVGIDENSNRVLKYSTDWTNAKREVVTYEPFDKFGTKTKQLLYVQIMRSGHEVYGLPDYYASMNWISLENEIGQHYLTSAREGFSPKMSVVFPGKPESEDLEDKIMDNLNKKYTGARGKKVIGVFSPRPELMPKFEPIAVENIDKQYQVIDDQTQAKILTGHGVVSPMLFGIKTAGQLGGSTELQTAFNIYQATVVAPYQNLIQRSLDEILEASGNSNRLKMSVFDIIQETNIDTEEGNKVADALNGMSPLLANKVLENLTINEIRALAGLDKVADGDEVKSQIQNTIT